MPQEYFSILKKIRAMRRNYKSLNIEDKILLLQLEIRSEGKRLKISDAHTKSEKERDKQKSALIRKRNRQSQ